MFHNAIQPEGKEEKDPIQDDRVYHIWYGVSILTVLNHVNVIAAMHHCGRGILDDTIEAGKVPICVGTSDFSGDQFEFAEVIEDKGLGRGITKVEDGVYFEDAKTSKYTGKQKEFKSQDKLLEMFKDVNENFETMGDKIAPFREGVIADTSADLAEEIMFGLKYYQMKRKSSQGSRKKY
jgi:hypothetical protein